MTKIFAHRGFSARYPENTMLAFRKAAETGCDGVELDVQLSRDGEPVVCHDEDLRRTTGRPGLVKDLTLRELRGLDAGCGFPAAMGRQAIPSLREYFSYVQGTGLVTDIELKNGAVDYEGLEEKVIRLVQEFGLADRVYFSSFNHYSMLKCKKICPAIPCALLTGDWIAHAGAYARREGVEFVNPQYRSLTDEAIRELEENGIGAQTWTVNDPKAMARLMDRHVFAVITNEPDAAMRVRASGKTAE